MPDPAAPVPTWRKILAAILDFFTVFVICGYAIAKFTDSSTEGGFALSGTPALILFALVAIYFFVGSKYAGGTLWQRILRTR